MGPAAVGSARTSPCPAPAPIPLFESGKLAAAEAPVGAQDAPIPAEELKALDGLAAHLAAGPGQPAPEKGVYRVLARVMSEFPVKCVPAPTPRRSGPRAPISRPFLSCGRWAGCEHRRPSRLAPEHVLRWPRTSAYSPSRG